MHKADLNTFSFILAFVALIIPFGLLWFGIYRRLKKDLNTTLNYCVLTLCTLVSLCCYFGLTANIAAHCLSGPVSTLVLGPSYVAFLFIVWPTIITFFITIVLTIKFFISKK